MKGDFLPPQVPRVRATRVGQHRTRSLVAFLAKGPPPGRHRAALPVWYRIVPAIVFFTAVGPAVASMVPNEPAVQPTEVEAIDSTAPETDAGTTPDEVYLTL
ncbi:MAG: hypothetical protein P1T08_17290 [Acidimicrobiia bacterium]|nr:hypothetical protein [Acidimicrobiia bacterium]